jgi:hypothetical protein
MSARLSLALLSSAVALVTLAASPLVAQPGTTTAAPMPGRSMTLVRPPGVPTTSHYVLSFQWSGSGGSELTNNTVTAVSVVRTARPGPANPGRTSAQVPGGQPGQLDITVSEDWKGALTGWHQATVEGRMRREDLTLTLVGPSGQVQQRCVYRNAAMISWSVIAGGRGDRPSFRAGFDYESVQCTAG